MPYLTIRNLEGKEVMRVTDSTIVFPNGEHIIDITLPELIYRIEDNYIVNGPPPSTMTFNKTTYADPVHENWIWSLEKPDILILREHGCCILSSEQSGNPNWFYSRRFDFVMPISYWEQTLFYFWKLDHP